MRPDHVYRSSENLSQPEPRCLVLLTHQFPHDFGDAAFVRNEIEALADEFYQVRIVSFWSGDEPALPIPDNCSYLGSVGRVTLRRVLRSALSWTRLRTFMHTLIRAARAREFHARDDVRAALVGMVIAHRLTELGVAVTLSLLGAARRIYRRSAFGSADHTLAFSLLSAVAMLPIVVLMNSSYLEILHTWAAFATFVAIACHLSALNIIEASGKSDTCTMKE